MHRLDVLILQGSPSHQIRLHQACNALGVFNVRIAADLAATQACLSHHPVDLLLVDHALPASCAKPLLEYLCGQRRARALAFIGEPTELVEDARQQGLWVLAQLSWPLPVSALQATLRRLVRPADRCVWRDMQTVMSPAHARWDGHGWANFPACPTVSSHTSPNK
ncbi:histidine kinase [Pseudomonas entomophila]|uniref:histidine kinase n=1 Tax=Pseudomonas entomophila TaxID=312306 RepID=UPI0031F2FDB1